MPARTSISLVLAALTSVSTVAVGNEPVVRDAWARATPPGIDKGAGYAVIENPDDQATRLTGGETPVAREIQIHETMQEEGQMHMRHIDEGLTIPAGGTVALEPMGSHLMLIDLEQPLEAGDEHRLTLEFSNGETVKTSLEVRFPKSHNAGSASNH